MIRINYEHCPNVYAYLLSGALCRSQSGRAWMSLSRTFVIGAVSWVLDREWWSKCQFSAECPLFTTTTHHYYWMLYNVRVSKPTTDEYESPLNVEAHCRCIPYTLLLNAYQISRLYKHVEACLIVITVIRCSYYSCVSCVCVPFLVKQKYESKPWMTPIVPEMV